MKRSTRIWLFRIVPLLTAGTFGVLLLLPASPPAANLAGDPSGAAGPSAAMALAGLVAPAPAPTAATSASGSPGAESQLAALVSLHRPSDGAPTSAVATSPSVTTLAAPDSPATASAATATAAAPTAPAALPAGVADGQVGAVAVNGRSGPSAGSAKLFVLAPGEPVKVGETSGSWVHVYRESGEDGWVFGRYLAGRGDAAAPAAPVAADPAPRVAAVPTKRPAGGDLTGRVAQVRSPVPVRAAPSSASALLFVLEPGESVRIAGSRGNWMRVVTSDGFSGWVPS